MGKYFPDTACHTKAQEFLELKQGTMTVMDWLTAYRVVIDCERRRVTAYMQDGTHVIFQGDKHDIFPQTMYESRCQG